jgi:hypothetical protein
MGNAEVGKRLKSELLEFGRRNAEVGKETALLEFGSRNGEVGKKVEDGIIRFRILE